MKYLVILAALFLMSCGSETEANKSDTNAGRDSLAAASDENEPIVWGRPILFHGFIGNNAIEAEFTFDKEERHLKGKYRYAQSKNDITLKTESVEWYSGNQYTLTEEDSKQQITGRWEFLRLDIDEAYKGRFISNDGKLNLHIVLLPNNSNKYLDSSSKMVFENAQACKTYFTINHFLHNETKDKQGLIVDRSNPSEGKEMSSNLLPEGLNFLRA